MLNTRDSNSGLHRFGLHHISGDHRRNCGGNLMHYRGKRLIPMESVDDYGVASSIGCSVDVLREERAAAFIDMVVALEKIGHFLPADATQCEILDAYVQHKVRVK